jgi:hypothetical protein
MASNDEPVCEAMTVYGYFYYYQHIIEIKVLDFKERYMNDIRNGTHWSNSFIINKITHFDGSSVNFFEDDEKMIIQNNTHYTNTLCYYLFYDECIMNLIDEFLFLKIIDKKYSFFYQCMEIKKWWPNGQLHLKYFYNNGQIDGLFQDWNNNGVLYRQCTYINGKINGLYHYYYDKQNYVIDNYSNDILNGLSEQYKDGKLHKLSIYSNGSELYSLNHVELTELNNDLTKLEIIKKQLLEKYNI